MRIISKFHDFYDTAMGLGMDKDTLYLRETAEVGQDVKYPWPWFVTLIWNSPINVESMIIGFCGKIYGALKVTKDKTNISKICYNTCEVDEFIETNFREDYVKAYNAKKKSYSPEWSGCCHQTIDHYFNKVKAYTGSNLDLFQKYPIFLGRYRKNKIYVSGRYTSQSIQVNPCLKDVEFFRVIDPYAAFQEVFMYVGGVLANANKPIPKLDDVTLLESKGFDKKSSFRKEPTKKRK